MLILICGEESARVDELRETLSDFGLDWKVEAIESAAQYAEAAGREHVEALVSTLPRDEARGQALAELRAAHPGAVRIMLLEPGQGDDALHLLDRAHRVLRRPMDPIGLVDALESVMELREVLDNPELKQAIGRIETLPAPPRLYLELVRLMRDPEVSMAAVSELLARDPAIAARVLRLCNSAYFSAGREVTDIRAASTRLGLQTLRQVVLASEALAHDEMDEAEREAMQARALQVSQLASRFLGGSSAELAATAGLLAEVGRLLPAANQEDADEEGGEAAEPDPAADQQHASAGAYLLGLWGLPDPIVEAVAFQYGPRRTRTGGFWVTGAVHVASALVNGTEVDTEYLRSVGQLDKLPRWQELAENSAGTGRAA
ncbi:HDOD domain-containing protein [Lysobacter sp. GX 14042]|uniref:HDOD domain-containing protein n=1 Tax=Lysobacter sp. GX 14042 TaxID=2907155 RepID=UPI001F2CAC0E|nr:HDOD domain-containing protein [Lysobacter sp. GX 14042]